MGVLVQVQSSASCKRLQVGTRWMTILREMSGAEDLELGQTDVKMAFLHARRHLHVSTGRLHGKGGDHLICRLKKRLFCLQQMPRIRQLGYHRSNIDPWLQYMKHGKDQSRIYLILYADDMLIVGKDRAVIVELKQKLHKTFSIKELENAWHMLGMRIEKNWLWKTL